MADLEQDDLALGNDNERIVVANIWSYWAHLSIYRFAVPFCRRRTVLDVGTGVGYGAAYLADHDANVQAIDGDPVSVAHAKLKYAERSVTYAVADLNQPLSFEDRAFDVVFSSNVFEHIANVDALVAECARIVKQDGAVIVAVPPITVAWIAQDDMRNIHHVHHLPPAAWHAKLSRFFGNIECHGHQGSGRWGEPEVQANEIDRWVDQTTIRETDFEFPAMSIAKLNEWQCITAIFVCREPKVLADPETLAEREPRDWNVGALIARVISEEGAKARKVEIESERVRSENNSLKLEIALVTKNYEDLLNSTTWRVFRPIRKVVAFLQGNL